MEQCECRANRALGDGGCLSFTGRYLEVDIRGLTAESNSARRGGVIASQNVARMTVINSQVIHNTALAVGGFLYSRTKVMLRRHLADVTLFDVTFAGSSDGIFDYAQFLASEELRAFRWGCIFRRPNQSRDHIANVFKQSGTQRWRCPQSGAACTTVHCTIHLYIEQRHNRRRHLLPSTRR